MDTEFKWHHCVSEPILFRFTMLENAHALRNAYSFRRQYDTIKHYTATIRCSLVVFRVRSFVVVVVAFVLTVCFLVCFTVKLDEATVFSVARWHFLCETIVRRKKTMHWNCDTAKISGFVYNFVFFVRWLLCTVSAHLAACAAAASIAYIFILLYIFHSSAYFCINYSLSLHFARCIQVVRSYFMIKTPYQNRSELIFEIEIINFSLIN